MKKYTQLSSVTSGGFMGGGARVQILTLKKPFLF